MLAGEVMNTGGLSRRIVDFAMALAGHIKGGLWFTWWLTRRALLESPPRRSRSEVLVGLRMGVFTPTEAAVVVVVAAIHALFVAGFIDPVYFGMLFTINNSIGLITPPVGTVLDAVAGVGKMRMDDVTRGVLPFMAMQFAIMFLLVLFSQSVMWPARFLYH